MTDALNSVIAQLADDNNASVQNSCGYSPYGESQTVGPDATNNSIQYTSRENDGTGLMFYRARYHDPVLKIFVSEDPIGLRGGVNVRAYVERDPISFVDSEGLAKSGRPVNIGNGSTVRVDKPHVGDTNTQTHAHVCQKGCKEIVINKDGTQSHGSRGGLQDLQNRSKKYLKEVGFTILSFCSEAYSLTLETSAQLCADGDYSACQVYLLLGGKREYD